jgi:hypothetical protein
MMNKNLLMIVSKDLNKKDPNMLSFKNLEIDIENKCFLLIKKLFYKILN